MEKRTGEAYCWDCKASTRETCQVDGRRCGCLAAANGSLWRRSRRSGMARPSPGETLGSTSAVEDVGIWEGVSSLVAREAAAWIKIGNPKKGPDSRGRQSGQASRAPDSTQGSHRMKPLKTPKGTRGTAERNRQC